MRSLLELVTDAKFDRGDEVFHSQATVREPGIITSLKFSPDDCVYIVSWGNRTESTHYAEELTKVFISEEERALKAQEN